MFLFLITSTDCTAGTTLHGLTGTMLVPGLEVIENKGARASVHFTGQSDFEQTSFKGVFSFSEDSEIAIIKNFGFRGNETYTDPVFAGKYKVRDNIAVAAMIDPNEEYKDSVMILTGLPGNRVVLGIGANIAMNGQQKESRFGRYDEYAREAEPLFFVMGASLNIDYETSLIMDYTGNDFCIGLRHRYDDNISLDLGIMTPDRINDKIRYVIGTNFGF